ncbi:MAG: hypothetical protein AB1Z98_21190 [Nannocystaceae bacterium]
MQWPEGWDASWEKVGRTSNTDYFVDDEGVLLALPHPGAVDTGATARENLDFQHTWFANHPDPPVVVIFFDRMVSQDRAARKLYSEDTHDPWALGFALVGGTLLSRAMGSFFLGEARTRIPLRFFATLPEARPWIRARQEQRR